MQLGTLKLAFMLFFCASANAADFDLKSCEFAGDWESVSESRFSTEIEYSPELFVSPSKYQQSFLNYTNTFINYNVGSVEQRLSNASSLWQESTSPKKNGILKIIDVILTKQSGHIRATSCIEWGLFLEGAKKHGLSISAPIYLEVSWSVWSKANRLKILLEKGQTTSVASDWGIFETFKKDGWNQLMDIHNHPGLHVHPTLSGLKDLGPDLFPSFNDIGYWESTEKFENKIFIITDGLSSIEFHKDEIETLHKIYFCQNYPDYYSCLK